jgi:hypothetical protein
MSKSSKDAGASASASRARRERSVRYPAVSLETALALVTFIDERGLDGLTAIEIAAAAGYKNVKTNAISARLSSARQFGLLALHKERYSLTLLARSLIHPADPAGIPQLRRQAFLAPPLYAEVTARLGHKKLPALEIVANLLYHHHHITASAKEPAAEALLESARFARLISEDGVFRPEGAPTRPASQPEPAPDLTRTAKDRSSAVRIDLRLWDADEGKVIQIRCPSSISAVSFERLLQALRLHVKIGQEPRSPDRS